MGRLAHNFVVAFVTTAVRFSVRLPGEPRRNGASGTRNAPPDTPTMSFIDRIQKLASETVIYGISTIVGRMINFLLVPLYLAVFDPGRYGVVGLVYTTFLILNHLYQHGMESSYLKFASGREGRERKEEVFSTASWSLLGVGLVLSTGVVWLREPISRWIEIGTQWSHLFYYVAAVLWLDTLAISASDEVTLLGKVSTDAEKAAAAEIASMVPSVKSVVNKLEMVKELSEGIAHKQDDIITRHVKEQFAKSVTVTSANFDVKTEQGVVSLSGTVRFQVIVLEAVEAARQVPGVIAVKTDTVKIESDG
jgi:hypothetical protein